MLTHVPSLSLEGKLWMRPGGDNQPRAPIPPNSRRPARRNHNGGAVMTSKPDADAVDRHILRILATDGRASYQAIADGVGLSRPAGMERGKRLGEEGIMTGHRARPHRAKGGF